VLQKHPDVFRLPWELNENDAELYLTRVGMRRLAAGVSIAKDSFVAANSIKIVTDRILKLIGELLK
jgi:hypothetical protein